VDHIRGRRTGQHGMCNSNSAIPYLIGALLFHRRSWSLVIATVPPNFFSTFEAAICSEQSRLSTIDDRTDLRDSHVTDRMISVDARAGFRTLRRLWLLLLSYASLLYFISTNVLLYETSLLAAPPLLTSGMWASNFNSPTRHLHQALTRAVSVARNAFVGHGVAGERFCS